MFDPKSILTELELKYQWKHNLVQLSDRHFVNTSFEQPKGTFADAQISSLDHGQESGSWWLGVRNKVIGRALERWGIGGCLWEIGAGAGAVGSYLSEIEVSCIGVEPSASGCQISATRGLFCIQSDFESLAIPDGSLGQIGLFDVLEHIEFRSDFLLALRRSLKDDGRLFLTVPALPFLWSKADVEASHFIRYTKSSISRELRAAGFRPLETRYFFSSLVIPLLFLRAIPYRLGIASSRRTSSLLQKNGGRGSLIFEKLESLMSKIFPIGSSILIVATKQPF